MNETLSQSIHRAQLHLTQLQYLQWKDHLFSDNWWLLLATLLIPWVVWWFLVKKARLFEILTYALLVVIIGTTLDIYGVNLCWWSYGTKLFYLNPGLIAGDWSLPPVFKSLIYQQFQDWPRFTAAIIILSALLSFALEPVLHLRGVYIMHDWSYARSLLVYLAVAIVSKLIMDQLKKRIPD